MESVRATVPVRLDLSGGTLDIWPIHLALPDPAITVNVGLDLPARATVRPGAGTDLAIHLRSLDLGQAVTYPTPFDLDDALREGACPLPLLGLAAQIAGPGAGFVLETDAGSPGGAGLGGSSALLIAIVAALMASRDEPVDPIELQRLAQDIETRLLGAPTGYQDYYPPLYGGLLALEGAPGGVIVERLEVPLPELQARIRIIDTGAPHVSGITNWGVVRAFLDGTPHTVTALNELADISRAQRTALRAGQLDVALQCLVDDGTIRRGMAPGVSTPEIERLDAGVRAAGALGTKICGAGGGGCLMVALPPEAGRGVDAWLQANVATGGSRVLDVGLAETGLELSPAPE